MDDGQGAPAPLNDGQPTAGEAKTTPSGDEAVLDALETQLQSEAVAEGAGDGEPEGDQADDESEDYEHQGKNYRVPKALKPFLMRDADYTRGKQTLADERKAFEAERESARKLDDELMQDSFRLYDVKQRLTALQNLTPDQWRQIEAKDAAQASRLTRELTLLTNQAASLEGEIRQKQHQALEKQSAERTKQIEESVARIAKKIPGWNDEKAGKLNDYAVGKGISLEELQGFLPRKNAEAYVEVLHNAYLFEQLMARTRAKPGPKAEAAPVVTVVPSVGARKSPVAKDPNKMSPEEYRTWRMNGGGSPRSAAR